MPTVVVLHLLARARLALDTRIDGLVDPGVKGDVRAKEKMKNDYGGHANMLKDLARITLKYESCDRMATAVKELKKAGFSLVVTKNKYLSPTVRS